MKIRYFIIRLLWKFPFVWRNYCWATAVLWADDICDQSLFEPANHKCFYCLTCNTKAEIEAYQKGD